MEDVAAARRMIDEWAEQTATLGVQPDVGYVLICEDGPHTFATVPPLPAAELALFPCTMCAEDAGDRSVADVPGWRAWVPASASLPFSMVVAPIGHRPDVPALTEWDRDLFAALLVDIRSRLDRLFAAPMPVQFWIHQRPTAPGDWPNAHLHLEICGLYRAPGTPHAPTSAERGSGVPFNPVPPAQAAARLRDT